MFLVLPLVNCNAYEHSFAEIWGVCLMNTHTNAHMLTNRKY